MERLLDRGGARARARPRRGAPAQSRSGPSACPAPSRSPRAAALAVVLDSGDYPRMPGRWRWRARDGRRFPARQQAARRDGPPSRHRPREFRQGHRPRPVRERAACASAPRARCSVASGAAAMGQGTKTMLAQIVGASSSACDLADIAVTTGDTAAIALGIGGFNSRQAVLAGARRTRRRSPCATRRSPSARICSRPRPTISNLSGGAVRVKAAPQMKVDARRDRARGGGHRRAFALPAICAPGLDGDGACGDRRHDLRQRQRRRRGGGRYRDRPRHRRAIW